MRGFHLIGAFEVQERGLYLIKGLPRSKGVAEAGPDFTWKRGSEINPEWHLDPHAVPFRELGERLQEP